MYLLNVFYTSINNKLKGDANYPFFYYICSMKIELENIRICDYISLLKTGKETQQILEIETELSKSIGNLGGGFDVGMFLLQKDLLLFQCKLAIAFLDFNDKKVAEYEKKINELKKEIERKAGKREKSTPYKNLLNWILSVEKYLGFSIDRNNDLIYLVEATNQMLRHYESQKANIEQQKVKK